MKERPEFVMYISGEQKKFLIIIGGSAFLLIADIFFVIKPLLKNTYNLQIQTVRMKKDIDTLGQQVDKIDSLKKKLAVLKSDYDLYIKKFPKEIFKLFKLYVWFS